MQEEILAKLYKYCAYQDRCTSEVSNKLTNLEVPSGEQASYLDHLRAERFLDDGRYARSFVRGKFFHQQWGRQKIKQALRGKELPEEIIEKTLSQEIDPEAYREQAESLVQQKWRSLEGETDEYTRKGKTSRYLMQKGYEWEIIAPFIQAISA